MASADTQRTIERLQRDIEGVQRQLNQVTQDEARKSQRIVQLTRDLTNTRSTSVLQSKQREINSCHSDIARLQSKRADLTKRVGDKTSELYKAQQQLFRQQTAEQSIALSKIQRDNERARTDQRVAVRSALASSTARAPVDDERYDAFISHATEDKDELVRPLAEKLADAGFKIWYDEFKLKLGDSLRQSIDRGLASSRFGIVVLSPSFFAKNWPQYELNGLVAREMNGGKVILPLWHKVSKDEVLAQSPSLADKLALNTAMYTLDELATELASALRDAEA